MPRKLSKAILANIKTAGMTEKAVELGKREAKNGGSVIPALCPDLMKLAEGCKPGEFAQVMKAFQRAFINEPI